MKWACNGRSAQCEIKKKMKAPSDSRILSAEKPVASTSSFGRWLVRYVIASPFGTSFSHQSAYFWRKTDAVKFVNSVR